MNNLKMQSPWQSFHGKVKTLFENDHLIEVGDLIDNGNGSYILPIEVKKHTKYEALARLLPRNPIFGNINLCSFIGEKKYGKRRNQPAPADVTAKQISQQQPGNDRYVDRQFKKKLGNKGDGLYYPPS